MRNLFKKSIRDLRQGYISFGSCSFMIALGAALFVAFSSSFLNLEHSCSHTYERLRFLDFYVPLLGSGAPASAVDPIRRIPGVEAVIGRRRASIEVSLPRRPGDNEERRVGGTMIGVPHRQRPAVNDLHVETGRYLRSARGEVLLERRFASAHDFHVGDVVQVKIKGRKSRLLVVGLVSSPEYLWYVVSREDPRPALERHGVLFVSDYDLCALTGDNRIQEIHVRVAEPQRRNSIMAESARLLSSYRPDPPVPREDQASNSLVLRDRRAFVGVAVLFPLVFLSLSSITLFNTLWQLISQQRQQIGVLMTQGFSNRQLVGHYLALSLAVGGTGSLVGALSGHFLGELSTRVYTKILAVPFVLTQVHWQWIVGAFLIGAGISLLAGWLALLRLLSLEPVEALRTDMVETVRAPRFEAWIPVLRKAGYGVRLPLRNLFRQPVRSAVSVFGIAFAVAQILMTLAFFDSQKTTLEFFFTEVHIYNLEAALPISSAADLPPLEHWPGVEVVEKCLRGSGILSGTTKGTRVGLLGLPPGSRLLRLYDQQQRRIEFPDDRTLLMGPHNLDKISATSGDAVDLEITSRDQEHSATVDYRVGPELYEVIAQPVKLSLRQLRKQEAAASDIPEDAINCVMLYVEPGHVDEVRRRLEAVKLVDHVIDIGQIRVEVRELLKMLGAYKGIMLSFSALLAFALLLGTTTMNVMERTREFATMSILGIRDRTLAGMLIVETLLLWLLGIGLGIPGGYLLGNWLVNHYQSDVLQITMALSPGTLWGTAWISLGLCLLAALNALRTVLRIPLKSASQGRLD